MKHYEYLNHILNQYSFSRYNLFSFKCKTCGICVWNSGMQDDFKYWILDKDHYSTGALLKLTCEEVVIKNILE